MTTSGSRDGIAPHVDDVDALKRRIAILSSRLSKCYENDKLQKSLAKTLAERVKELDCLYRISRLMEKRDLTLHETLQEVVDLMPAAWQYPDFTCVRLETIEFTVESKNFKKTRWLQICNLESSGKMLGRLEVFSMKSRIPKREKRFLAEEQKLLKVIAERISTLIAQHQENELARDQEMKLVQMDKMIALGILVSGVAHEINNPNNFIMLNTPLLQEAWSSIRPILDLYHERSGDFIVGGLSYSEFRDVAPRLFAGIQEGSQRIKSIVESLKKFSRVDPSEMTFGIDVNEVTRSAIMLLDSHIKKSTDRLSSSYGSDIPPVRGHFQRLEQVVINLLQNACDALPDKSRGIWVETSFDRESRQVVIEIRDEGVGIESDKLSSIRDPFYTTKRDRGGTGLGLSVSSGIIENHHGQLFFRSEPGRGTTVTVLLPAVSNEAGDKKAD